MTMAVMRYRSMNLQNATFLCFDGIVPAYSNDPVTSLVACHVAQSQKAQDAKVAWRSSRAACVRGRVSYWPIKSCQAQMLALLGAGVLVNWQVRSRVGSSLSQSCLASLCSAQETLTAVQLARRSSGVLFPVECNHSDGYRPIIGCPPISTQ